jgi:hypothetical protein
VTAPTPVLPAYAPDATSKPARPPGHAGSLPRAAQALLEAWNGLAEGGHVDVAEIIGPIASVRAALAASASAHQPIDRRRAGNIMAPCADRRITSDAQNVDPAALHPDVTFDLIALRLAAGCEAVRDWIGSGSGQMSALSFSKLNCSHEL